MEAADTLVKPLLSGTKCALLSNGSAHPYAPSPNRDPAGDVCVLETPPVLVKDAKRWYILSVFSLATCFQSLFWLTFSSIPRFSEEYYDIDERTVDLLLAWGPIFYIPAVLVAPLVIRRENGLRQSVLICTILTVFATGIRALPSLVAMPRFWTLACIHIGQILNAAAGPFVMCCPSVLSAHWFPSNEATTATAVGQTMNNMGSAIGFILGPAIVSSASELPRLLYVEFLMALVPVVCVLIHFPSHPKVPATLSAWHALEKVRSKSSSRAEGNGAARDTAAPNHLVALLTDPTVLLLLVAGGVQTGITVTWQGLLPNVLHMFTPLQAGWLAFGNTLAGIIGGIVFGAVSDRLFPRCFKGSLIWLYVAGFVFASWFTLSLPSPVDADGFIPSNMWILATITIILGVATGANQPIFYEALAETSHPVPEGHSAALLTLALNLTSVAMLFVSPQVDIKWTNTIMTLGMAACLLLTLPIRPRYKRSEENDGKVVTDDLLGELRA